MFNYNQNDDRDLLEKLLENINREFEHNLRSSAIRSGFHVLYKELSTSLVGNHYINEVNNSRKMSIIMRLRGESLNLNYNISREERARKCALCNLGALENVIHFVGLCPILQEFRLRWLGQQFISYDVVIKYLNGDFGWENLYKYTECALKDRNFLINEFNF